MSNQVSIGFLGLGNMGAPMAERLIAPDIRLHVFDPRPEAVAAFTARGAIGCASAREVADKAEVVFACLPNGTVSEAVAAEVATGGAVRAYAEMSTIGKETIGRIAALMGAKGIGFVDAPISGGPAGARAGTLAMLAAGAPEARALVEPLQRRIGREVFTLGDTPGLAQVMKLVNNLLFAANLTAACEAFALGAKAGIDADTMLRMVNAGTGRSMATEKVMEEVISGRFAFGAAVSILDKDVRLGVAEATALGVPMWTLEQMARVWRLAAVQGHGAEDLTVVARMMEGWTGAPIRRG